MAIPETSLLVTSNADSNFGFEAMDVVAKPLAGFAAGFVFFFLLPPAMTLALEDDNENEKIGRDVEW